MPPSPVEELALLDLDRSNKGASKQRRDQINSEIARMRDLLPLPESARQRLSQLQIMSLSCVFIRKCNVLNKLFRSLPVEKDVPALCDFFQALTGFLLITTREGKLVYISENVTDYLGHSMVDMKTQGDSLYDIVDKRDHGTVQAQLLQGGAELDLTRDVAFFCRMNMSRTLKRQAGFGDVKVMHVRGHFIPLSDPDGESSDQPQQPQQQKYVFMATCSPLITPELKENLIQSNTTVFKTVHQLDMTFLEVTNTAEYYLGYTTEEMFQTSWYSMLHPEDIHEAREKHILLIRSSHEMGCMMTVRMLCAQDQVLWVNVVMHVRQASSSQNDDPLIVCINQVISEEEAYQIRMQSHMFTLYPARTSDLWAGGLSSPHTAPLPQTSPPDGAARWAPNTTVMAPPVHGPPYGGPVGTYYVSAQPPQTLPTCTVNYSMHDSKACHLNPPFSSSSSSPPSCVPLPPGQTDKLKLMLKRKIQGPCRPAKVPKLMWDEHSEGDHGGHVGRQGYEYAATGDPMHSPDSASQLFSSSGGYSWPASTQLLPQVQYRMAHVLPAHLALQHSVKAHLLPSPCPPTPVSPPESAASQGKEQVVPSSCVAVPESYLTPDPSPASSPHPHTSYGHAADTEVKSAPSSTAILQELEKLASLSSTRSTPASAPAASSTRLEHIKVEKMDPPDCGQSAPQRGLPVMDAFDIESFFDTLCKVDTPKAGPHGKEEQATSKDPAAAGEAVAKEEAAQSNLRAVIKQEPPDTEPCSPAPHVDVNPPAKEAQPQPSSMDPSEVEELLSYFSTDLTATQLNLADTLLSSQDHKEEADVLVAMAKTVANGYRPSSPLCEATHLGHFLLHGEGGLQRPQEEFSPLSSTDASSDINSEVSGDEESGGEEVVDTPRQSSDRGAVRRGQRVKKEGGDGHQEATPPYPSPPNTHPHPQTPQDVPGIHEEDELYQLDKILSSMATDNGMRLCGERQ